MIHRLQVDEVGGARLAKAVVNDNWAFFSGIHADDFGGDIKEQARAAFAKLDGLLAETGLGQGSIFVIHIWLKDMRYFSAMNAEWNAWADAENPPARTCVSGELFRPDALVELVVMACNTGKA